MTTLFESIFGAAAQNQAYDDLFDARAQGLANQQFNNAYGQYAQQQSMNNAQNQLASQAYNQVLSQYNMYKDQPKWVFNGKECTLKEFTEALFPDDPEAQLLFILKHGGV